MSWDDDDKSGSADMSDYSDVHSDAEQEPDDEVPKVGTKQQMEKFFETSPKQSPSKTKHVDVSPTVRPATPPPAPVKDAEDSGTAEDD